MYVLLVLQNVVTLSVNLADNMMLGAYGEAALSGVTAVNQIQFVFQQVLIALGEGVVILASQYWGKREAGPAGNILAASLRFAAAAALILFAAVSILPNQLMMLFTDEPAIIEEGIRYLRIIRFSYLFFSLTQILLAALRSVKVMQAAFYLSVMTFFLNCGMNYLLIFGNLGFPRLGAAGAAIGTLTARIGETAAVVFYMIKKRDILPFTLNVYRKTSKTMTGDYWKVVLPLLVTQGLWGINTALQTAVLGHMDSAAIAANSAASTLFLLVKSAAVGAAGAASVLIGTTVGSGRPDLVKLYARRLQRIFVGIGIVSGVTLFFLRIPVLSMYRLSESAMGYANAFLIVLSVVCAGMSYQMPTNAGIIKGGGNTGFVLKMDLISIWCIVVPLSLIMAFVVKASPVVVVCCLNADQIFKCIPAFLMVNYGNWIRKLTRDEAGDDDRAGQTKTIGGEGRQYD